ncbi:MAG: helix-turn-helix domain-containing protein [Bacteroidales bacterium]|nr:helix-turn-helix domain-containing protein [Bacteroidales bacterium]
MDIFAAEIARMEQALTSLYALPVYQCLVLAIILFYSGRQFSRQSRMIMGGFLGLLSIYFLFNFLYRLKAFEAITSFYFFILPVILSFSPVFYIYLLSITQTNFRLKSRHLLHFIPAATVLIINTPYLFLPHELKLEFIRFGYSMIELDNRLKYLIFIFVFGMYGISNIQLISYLLASIRVYRKHRDFIANHYSYTENIDLSWTRALIIAFIIFFVLNNLLFIIGFKQHIASLLFYTLSMLSITLFAGLQALKQKEIEIPDNEIIDVEAPSRLPQREETLSIPDIENDYKHALSEDDTEMKVETIQKTIENEPIFNKYSNSSLSEEQKASLIKQLETLIENEKIYTIDNLSIHDVALRLGTNSKYISQIINEYYQKNFYNYINEFRIEEAKRLLKKEDNNKYSILGIANMVGFSSKSAFNSAFRKFTGTTPSEFRKS